MSFTIQLFNMTSAKNRIEKDKTQIGSDITGEFRNESSIINPDIVFRIDDVSTLKHCNYMYIEQFERYYFVNDIISLRNRMVEIKAHVDVLETYKAEILKNSAIIARNEKSFNMYISDNQLATSQDNYVVSYDFPSSFEKSEENIILCVAGSHTSTS